MEEEHFRTPQGEVFLFALRWWIKAQIVFAACFALTPAPLPAMWMRTTTAF
jgi:hypothetical protein